MFFFNYSYWCMWSYKSMYRRSLWLFCNFYRRFRKLILALIVSLNFRKHLEYVFAKRPLWNDNHNLGHTCDLLDRQSERIWRVPIVINHRSVTIAQTRDTSVNPNISFNKKKETQQNLYEYVWCQVMKIHFFRWNKILNPKKLKQFSRKVEQKQC